MHLIQRHPFVTALIVLALAGGAGALFYGKKDKPAAPAPAPAAVPANAARPALTVTTTLPQRSELPIALSANGNVAAWQEASIAGELNGLRLAEVLVNVGDVVQRGQLLARFATDSIQTDVAQARAGVAEATAQAAEASANADRVRTLQNTGTFSGQQMKQILTAEQTAKARVESAVASLAAQTLRLQNTQVLSPDSGVISARNATVGAVPGNGMELFRLIRQGRLEWRAEVTSSELARLRPGTPVLVSAASGAQRTGRVRMVGPTVDPQTRVGLVYVDLPSPSGAKMGATFLPGMFAKGEFELGKSSGLTVPQQAVVVRDGFSYVFRLNPDQRVSQLKVQVGRRVGDRLEVLQGLDAQAVLVASGAGFLNDGDLVKQVAAPVVSPAVPVAPAAAAAASAAK